MIDADGLWDQYVWIVVCGALAAFYMAWGIGANDVANAFATSVGARTLNMWQACVIASIFEFLGAMVLGGETAKTISSDISNVSMFKEFPEIYMYGMLCSLAVAGTWLMVATYWSMAVSTTHSIIGAVMGFSLVFGGWNGVIWHKDKADFPYTSGFLPVVLSWFVSPILGGFLSSIIFNLNRFFILRRENSTNLAIYSLPVLIFVTLFINLMFILSKGATSQMKARWPCSKDIGYKGLPYDNCSNMYNAAVWISAACAGGIAIIAGAIFIPVLKRKVANEAMERQDAAATSIELSMPSKKEDPEAVSDSDNKSVEAAQKYQRIHIHEIPTTCSFFALPYHYALYLYTITARQIVKGLFFDVHCNVQNNTTVAHIHAEGEVFKPATETIYMYLQVITACCVAFAHGSNDVANSIGPFSAIYAVYTTHNVPSSKTDAPKWIFALGGLGIVLGIITYAYNIIMELGVSLLKLTPSRGYSAELGAGLTISLASFFGLPVSTTQIIVGAEVGVGMSENLKTGCNYKLLLRTFLGWVWTILLAVGFSAALFSAGAYAPSIIMADEIKQYQESLYFRARVMYNDMNAANNAVPKTDPWWTVPTNKTSAGSNLTAAVSKGNSTFYKAMYETDKKGSPTGFMLYNTPGQIIYYFDSVLQLTKANSNTTIGK